MGMGVTKIQNSLDVQDHDRYKYNPDFIVSQSIDLNEDHHREYLSPDKDFKRLQDDVQSIKQSLEFIKLEQNRKSIEDYPQRESDFDPKVISDAKRYSDNNLNPNKPQNNRRYDYPVYQDSPEQVKQDENVSP